MAIQKTNDAREFISDEPFSVRARVAMQLGRESISSSITAIAELVKNSYDADASQVSLYFSNTNDEEKSQLVISDDGNGMTLDQVINNWMVIGTDNKAMAGKSKKNRVFVGEKGLGRLGLDRLSHQVTMQTFAENDDYGTELEIDWRLYEQNTHNRLEEVKHKIYRIEKIIEKGTILTLKGLKDKWVNETISELRKDISLLISPFGGVDDFAVWLYSGLDLPLDGKVGSGEILEKAEWKLAASLENHPIEGWSISYRITSPEDTRSIREKWDGIPRCGEIRFDLYFYSRGDVKREDAKNASLDRGQINSFLENNQGIRIYRDNFRVKPYGEPSGQGDWLGLSLRRVKSPQGVRQPGRWKVGYNQVVGAIFIEREKNSSLLDQTNREGIVEGVGFADLKRFSIRAVEFFEVHRQAYERARVLTDKFADVREEANESSKAAFEAVDQLKNQLADVVTRLKSEEGTSEQIRDVGPQLEALLDNVTITQAAIETNAKAQEEMVKAHEERQQEFEQKENTLGNLASLGIVAAAFGHETIKHISLTKRNFNLLKSKIVPYFGVAPLNTFNNLNEHLENMDYGITQTNLFAEFTLSSVQRDKRERKNIYLDKIAKDVFHAFSLNQVYDINVETDYERSLPPIRAFRIDWESIFVNFITNSVWALRGKSGRDRIIRLKIAKNKKNIKVSFADGGIGIEAGSIDRIFEPTFSTRTNPKGDVVGTGMGLAIVENLVSSYYGKIDVDAHCDLGGAEFHIEVPLAKQYSSVEE